MPTIKRKESNTIYDVSKQIVKDGEIVIPENTKTARMLRRIVSGDNAESLSKKFEWDSSEIKTKPKAAPKVKVEKNKKSKSKKGKK